MSYNIGLISRLYSGGKVDAMLYWLIEHSDQMPVFNVLRYIAIRAGGAIATALVLMFFFRPLISLMGPGRRSAPPVQVVSRIGTPAVDALALLSIAFVSTVLWTNLLNLHLWIAIGAATAFGLIGFHDDYLKMIQRTRSQFSHRTRLLIETVIAIAAWIAFFRTGREPLVTSLLFGWPPVVSGLISLALSIILVVSTANAVKLIDSGDRSAIVTVMIAAVVLGMVTYLSGGAVFANDLQVQYVVGELAVLCATMVGICLGLVWFKAASAPVFIGDTGSLALGAALGTIVVAIL
jgi:phospho-N-acetylmuramoyl-pentapeptide-transferase